MRTSTPAFTVALLLIAVLSLTVAVLALATQGFGTSKTFLDTLGSSLFFFLIGTVALGTATIVLAVDDGRKQQAALLERIASAIEAK